MRLPRGARWEPFLGDWAALCRGDDIAAAEFADWFEGQSCFKVFPEDVRQHFFCRALSAAKGRRRYRGMRRTSDPGEFAYKKLWRRWRYENERRRRERPLAGAALPARREDVIAATIREVIAHLSPADQAYLAHRAQGEAALKAAQKAYGPQTTRWRALTQERSIRRRLRTALE